MTQLKQYLSSRKVPTAVISQTLEKWSDTDILFKRHGTNSSSWSRHNFDRRPHLWTTTRRSERIIPHSPSRSCSMVSFVLPHPSYHAKHFTSSAPAIGFQVPATRCTHSGPTLLEASQCDTTCKNCTTLTKMQNRADSNASDASSSPGEST